MEPAQRSRWQGAAVSLLLMLAACDDHGPAPSGLPLRPGRYLLSMIGYDFSGTPSVVPCDQIGVPPEGKFVNARIVITHERDELVGRSESVQTGTIELRLRPGGSALATPVVGTIRGTAADVGLGPVPAKPVQVSLSGSVNGAAAVDGSIPQLTFGQGSIQGSIRFTNVSGAFTDCPMVTWTLNEDTR